MNTEQSANTLQQISPSTFHWKYIYLMKNCCEKFKNDVLFVHDTKKILNTLIYKPPNSGYAFEAIFGRGIHSMSSRKNFYNMLFDYCVNHRKDDGITDIIHDIDKYIHDELSGFEDAVMKYTVS